MEKETVIDLEKVRMQRMAETLSRLVKEKREAISKDPWPTINRLQNELRYLMELLFQVNVVANPVEVHLESEYPIQPSDITKDAVERIEVIREILKGL